MRAKNTLIIGTFFMVVVPVLTFFIAARTLFAPVSQGGSYTDDQSLTYSGFAAAVAVNFVSIGYVAYATCFDPERHADYPEDAKAAESANKKND